MPSAPASRKARLINNEQVAVAIHLNEERWQSFLHNLRESTQDPTSRFECLFVIDDFVGSGSTLLRCENGKWKGKLIRFYEDFQKYRETHLSSQAKIYVHHYVGSDAASKTVVTKRDEAAAALGKDWFSPDAVEFTFGHVLPQDMPVTPENSPEFLTLIEKYYDSDVQTTHTQVGGGENIRLGFGQCALPLVLEHNTPNNSIAILWAETEGNNGHHAMRPLFRRRQRHV